jgi:hypothetical protein
LETWLPGGQQVVDVTQSRKYNKQGCYVVLGKFWRRKISGIQVTEYCQGASSKNELRRMSVCNCDPGKPCA